MGKIIGRIHDIDIKDFRFPNIGLGELEGIEFRVKETLPGEKVKVRISKKRNKFYEAKVLERLKPSSLEREADCPHFGLCNGCRYQNISYEDELELKKTGIENLFENKNLDIKIDKITGNKDIYAYRNKMEFTFGDEYKEGPLTLGLHQRGKFFETITVDKCNICHSDFTKILSATLEFFNNTDLNFYNTRSHIGELRHLIIRRSTTRGELMVNLVTSSQKEIPIYEFKNILLDLDLKGKIVSVLHTIDDNVGNAISPDEINLIYGRDYIIEDILDLEFMISPFSFFQPNTKMAEYIYSRAQEIVSKDEGLNIFDLYSGTGTIAQLIADVQEKVTAMEIVPEAVETAKKNAKTNDLNNIEFLCGDAFKILKEMEIEDKPDIIIIDPSRAGLEKAAEEIIEIKPEKLIYISCNPVTFARDVEKFIESGYKIESLEMVDQFSRTSHIETIALLQKESI